MPGRNRIIRATALTLLAGAGGCSSPSDPKREDDAIVVDDDESSQRAACPRATGCEILGRYVVGSAAAIERGFVQFTVEHGAVVCDPEAVDCGWLDAPPRRAIIVETSRECGLWSDYLVMTAANVYIQRPQSIGAQGGPGWALVAVDGADPDTYEPLPHGFGRDATRVYQFDQPLLEADRDSFEVLESCLACDATQCW